VVSMYARLIGPVDCFFDCLVSSVEIYVSVSILVLNRFLFLQTVLECSVV
jgi:hypothetical protein